MHRLTEVERKHVRLGDGNHVTPHRATPTRSRLPKAAQNSKHSASGANISATIRYAPTRPGLSGSSRPNSNGNTITTIGYVHAVSHSPEKNRTPQRWREERPTSRIGSSTATVKRYPLGRKAQSSSGVMAL